MGVCVVVLLYLLTMSILVFSPRNDLSKTSVLWHPCLKFTSQGVPSHVNFRVPAYVKETFSKKKYFRAVDHKFHVDHPRQMFLAVIHFIEYLVL